MSNTTCTIFLGILLSLVGSASSLESFGRSEDLLLQRNSGKEKSFDFADEEGYDSLFSMNDEDYRDNQDAADEFSFVPDEPQASSSKQVKKKACSFEYCDGRCYSPMDKQCCNGIALDKFWSCSKCNHFCEDRCYPKGKGYKCCYGNVVPDAWPCCQHYCAGKCYNTTTQKCCYDNLIDRSKICCENYCGDNCYNTTETKCCNNQVIQVNSTCCASGETVCGSKCFVAKTHKCCYNKVIPVGSTCCASGEKVCGRGCFNPATQKCCNSKVLPGSGSCGCTRCGGNCIDTKTQDCCHQRIIMKSVPCILGSGSPLRITTGLIARRVGCFRDHWNRAIPTLERKSRLLEPVNYQLRSYAIEKCALAAAKLGWSVFAVQHQGWCASSATAGRTYNKYGAYNTCRNGKGGPWGNDVYVLEGNASKKTTEGDICVFPFIYKGKSYNGCTRVDRNRPWCAITPNYDVDGLAGNC